MKKYILPAILSLLCLGTGLILFFAVGGEGLNTSNLNDLIQTSALQAVLISEPGYGLDSVDLAVSGVRLSQGADGSRQWVLDAQYATVRQNQALLDIGAPRVSYAMSSQDGRAMGNLTASSNTGRLDNYLHRMIMTGDVLANYRFETVSGPRAIYYNQQHVLEFSSGVRLQSPQLSGRAGSMRWDLTENILYAEEGVAMIWTPYAQNPEEEQAAF